MAIHNSPEERQIIKLVEKIPFAEADRKAWIEQIQATGVSEELVEQIHAHLTSQTDGKAAIPNRAIYSVEFSKAVQHWRMALGAKKFR
jgi:hypothetical protein